MTGPRYNQTSMQSKFQGAGGCSDVPPKDPESISVSDGEGESIVASPLKEESKDSPFKIDLQRSSD